LFSASGITPRGYYHYGFQDLVALRTISILKKKGFSTYQIRKSFESLKNKFPAISNPFVQKPVIVTGKRVAIIDRGNVYDALTGQMLIIKLEEIELWVNELKEKHKDISFDLDKTYKRTKKWGAK